MVDLSNYDPDSVSNPNNNIFGLPTTEEDAQLVIVPVPWEVTVSYGQGTARGPEKIFDASMQVDLYDPDVLDGWKKGFYMLPVDKNIPVRFIRTKVIAKVLDDNSTFGVIDLHFITRYREEMVVLITFELVFVFTSGWPPPMLRSSER